MTFQSSSSSSTPSFHSPSPLFSSSLFQSPLPLGNLNIEVNNTISDICVLVKKMNWSYRDDKENRIFFTEEETKPLIATYTTLRKVAHDSGMSIFKLAKQSFPILEAYYEVTKVQGLSQFESRLAALRAQKENLDKDEFEKQEMTLESQMAAYEQDATKYAFNHMRNKFCLDDDVNDRKTTDEEHAFCSFLTHIKGESLNEKKAAKKALFDSTNSSTFTGTPYGPNNALEGMHELQWSDEESEQDLKEQLNKKPTFKKAQINSSHSSDSEEDPFEKNRGFPNLVDGSSSEPEENEDTQGNLELKWDSDDDASELAKEPSVTLTMGMLGMTAHLNPNLGEVAPDLVENAPQPDVVEGVVPGAVENALQQDADEIVEEVAPGATGQPVEDNLVVDGVVEFADDFVDEAPVDLDIDAPNVAETIAE